MELQTLSRDNAVCWILGQALDKRNQSFAWVTDKYCSLLDVLPVFGDLLNTARQECWYCKSHMTMNFENGSVIYLKVAHPHNLCGFSLDGVIVSNRVEEDTVVGVSTCLMRTRGWLYRVWD